MEQKHKRRPHYSGKYPRRFEEKYKEQNPEKYGDTIEHGISKGSTPAGMHIPIMVDEILGFLEIKPGEIGLDCTLGYGGHSLRMLQALSGQAEASRCIVFSQQMDVTIGVSLIEDSADQVGL